MHPDFQDLKDELRRLPSFEPPGRSWNAIRLELLRRRAHQRPSRAPLAALAASVIIAVLVLPMTHRTGSLPTEPSRAMPPATNLESETVDALVSRSQRLEAALQILPPRPLVERAGTSATIDELQNRIQVLDLQLSANVTSDLASGDAQRLWSARVELMNSLVHVRYAEAAGSADLSQPSNTPGAI
jgi:hypothetical protein